MIICKMGPILQLAILPGKLRLSSSTRMVPLKGIRLAKKFVWVFSTAAFGKEQNWKYRNDEGQYQRALVQLFPQHCVFLDTVGT